MSAEGKTRQELEQEIVAKAWKDEAFKQQLLSNPKKTIAKEIGIEPPENIEVRVLEVSSNTIYFVIPMKPSEMEAEGELSEEALEAVAGGIANESYLNQHWGAYAFSSVTL